MNIDSPLAILPKLCFVESWDPLVIPIYIKCCVVEFIARRGTIRSAIGGARPSQARITSNLYQPYTLLSPRLVTPQPCPGYVSDPDVDHGTKCDSDYSSPPGYKNTLEARKGGVFGGGKRVDIPVYRALQHG